MNWHGRVRAEEYQLGQNGTVCHSLWITCVKQGGNYLRIYVNYLLLFLFSSIIWIIWRLFYEKTCTFWHYYLQLVKIVDFFALFEIVLDFCMSYVDYFYIICFRSFDIDWNSSYLVLFVLNYLRIISNTDCSWLFVLNYLRLLLFRLF